ncbi:MAG: hypothetical protein IT432_07510 [Phycisphaerales bacterium]|nr:hypothetical protein [Phycisphaerales bacterium]
MLNNTLSGPRAGIAAALIALAIAPWANAGHTNNIMITGYWPPTNWMVSRFSTSTELNPDGWIGGNWEGRGYNVYSFFPTFNPDDAPNWGKGTGDFEVDYQDTSADWQRIVNQIKPAAIITFSRGNAGVNWEVESRLKMRAPNAWFPDYLEPKRPSADMPIFADLAANQIVPSTLPMQGIVDAVKASGAISNAYIDTGNGFGGAFLSEFIGLHGEWYNLQHSGVNDPYRNYAAGHIHVGIDTPLAAANMATEATLRVLTDYLDTVVPAPGTAIAVSLGLTTLARRRRASQI